MFPILFCIYIDGVKPVGLVQRSEQLYIGLSPDVTLHIPVLTYSLTHWTAWPATGRCAVQTSRSSTMSQPSSALSPTSTSSCTPDPRDVEEDLGKGNCLLLLRPPVRRYCFLSPFVSVYTWVSVCHTATLSERPKRRGARNNLPPTLPRDEPGCVNNVLLDALKKLTLRQLY